MNISRKTFLLYLLQIPFFVPFLKRFLHDSESKKYLLNKFSIAGFQFYDGTLLFQELKVGTQLELDLEPNNPYDGFAVKINYNSSQIGYVPRSDNRHISRLLQKGVHLSCEIISLFPDADPWHQVRVAVNLLKLPEDSTLA